MASFDFTITGQMTEMSQRQTNRFQQQVLSSEVIKISGALPLQCALRSTSLLRD